jgi:hypothetical protein
VIALACWLVSVAGMLTMAALGSSAAVPPIPGSTHWPPYSVAAHPADGVVYVLGCITAVAGAVATWRMLTASRRGHGIDARWLLAAGALVAGVLTLLPPTGGDILNYVAYGEEAASGVNPYTAGPQSPGVPQSAITAAVPSPWQTTPSIYGPLFTKISAAIAHVAHGDGHLAVTLMRLLLTGSFVLTGLVLYAVCGTPAGRRRAAVLWSANPLLLFTLVAGAHVDALVTAAIVCAIALVRRSPLAAGALLALAATVKLSALIAVPGVVLALLPRVRSAGLVVLGACAVAVPWYAATPGVFTQLSTASHFATPAAPWRGLAALLEPAFGHDPARTVMSAAAAAAGLALIALLLRRGLPPATDSTASRAAAISAAFAIGWLLTTAYILPWYDALAWAPLALAGASFLDRVLLVHTTTLVLAFLPGIDVPLDHWVDLTQRVVHSGLSPAVLAVLVVVTVRLAVRTRQDTSSSPWGPLLPLGHWNR